MNTTQTPSEPSGFAEFDNTAQQISEEASDKIPQVADMASPRQLPISARVSAYAYDARQQMSRAGTSATATIQERPLTSLLAAGAVGWVLGMLAGSRR
jgi:ElaB/YqjD/DUF883 family membrane-anchored ribosome-binding protein